MNAIKKKVKAKGTYQFIVNGEKVLEKDNLIVNQGLQGAYSFFRTDYGEYCHLGTGTTPAELSDTTLESKTMLVSKTSKDTTYSTVSGVKYKSTEHTYLLDVGAFIGTLSEVGVGTIYGNTNIASRTLLDTPLTLTATDQLTIVYVLTLEIPSFDDTTVINIFGTDVSCRLVSTNAENRTSPGSFAFSTSNSNTAVFLEDMTHIVKDQSVLNVDYSHEGNINAGNITSNSYRDNASGAITLIPTDANHTNGIYAVGFSNSSLYPLFMLIFDQPIMKTDADQITITIDIQLVMENA